MEKQAIDLDEGVPTTQIDAKWDESLQGVMRDVISKLPDETSLGDIVSAARSHPYMSRVLRAMSVHDLIVLACERTSLTVKPTTESAKSSEGGLDLSTANVIRRRADVPNGDVIVLRYLTDQGPTGELALGRATHLTSEQVRLLLRNLGNRGLVHGEGSGLKKKFRVTRAGQSALRRSEPLERSNPATSKG